MDRRKSIKALVVGTVATGVVVQACKSSDDKKVAADAEALLADRMQEEKDHLKKVEAEPEFFTAHELATITVLSDIIVPKDAISGSATEAKVPEFIAFIVKVLINQNASTAGIQARKNPVYTNRELGCLMSQKARSSISNAPTSSAM